MRGGAKGSVGTESGEEGARKNCVGSAIYKASEVCFVGSCIIAIGPPGGVCGIRANRGKFVSVTYRPGGEAVEAVEAVRGWAGTNKAPGKALGPAQQRQPALSLCHVKSRHPGRRQVGQPAPPSARGAAIQWQQWPRGMLSVAPARGRGCPFSALECLAPPRAAHQPRQGHVGGRINRRQSFHFTLSVAAWRGVAGRDGPQTGKG